ncbi:MAG: helix-turn-helix transcriptional regulator [Ruminococcaceae bacterium]|nr:helix-turn-helix transcriptional regulator [Oscillospiraceae bacterium]
MKIGDKLRKAKKLMQEQLAEYWNVTARTGSTWETGLSSPDVNMLPRLIKAKGGMF